MCQFFKQSKEIFFKYKKIRFFLNKKSQINFAMPEYSRFAHEEPCFNLFISSFKKIPEASF
jgi:hypothetical protein